MRAPRLVPVLSLVPLILAAPAARASWPTDPTVALPVCTAANDATVPHLAADGSGGFIVVWEDFRNFGATLNTDIFAQRISGDGDSLWAANGVPVCTANAQQVSPIVVPDGAGGAFLAWDDYRYGADLLFMQSFDSTGTRRWTANGIEPAAEYSKTSPRLLADGAGGLFMAWADLQRNVVRAQHFNALGQRQWIDLLNLGFAVDAGLSPTSILSDGAGGLLISTNASGGATTGNVRAQHLNANGTPLWGGAGLGLALGHEPTAGLSTAVSDGANGIIVIWRDQRNGSYDVFAQRVDAIGGVRWAAEGAPVCVAPGSQAANVNELCAVADGAGGVVVAWQDMRTDISGDLYAQRLDADGNALWGDGGVPVAVQPRGQNTPVIAHTSDGNFLIVWSDSRTLASDYDIYAQKLSPSGAALWSTDGVPVAIANGRQREPDVLATGTGGAFVVWSDNRAGTSTASNCDIMAARLTATGVPGSDGVESGLAPPALSLRVSGANPSRAGTRLVYTLDREANVRLDILDLAGRRIARIADGPSSAGEQRASWSGRDDSGAPCAPGIYFARLTAGTGQVAVRIAQVR